MKFKEVENLTTTPEVKNAFFARELHWNRNVR